MEKIRIGIVGAGENTRVRHIPGLREQSGVEIISVCNRSLDSSRRVAARFSIPRVDADWRELVNAGDINAVLIGTWPYMHHPVATAALAAGKHVLCEARMAATAAEAREMLQAAGKYPDLVAQVVPSPFTLTVDTTIKRLLLEGYIGELLTVEIMDREGFINRDLPFNWRYAREYSGDNIMSLGIWYEALMRWLGEAESVHASGEIFVRERRDPDTGKYRSVDIPDHLEVSALMHDRVRLHMLITRIAGLSSEKSVTLYGSEGILRYSDDTLSLLKRGEEVFKPVAIAPGETGGWRVEADFIESIRTGKPVTHTSFSDGLKYMEFTDAVSRCLKERREIRVRQQAQPAAQIT